MCRRDGGITCATHAPAGTKVRAAGPPLPAPTHRGNVPASAHGWIQVIELAALGVRGAAAGGRGCRAVDAAAAGSACRCARAHRRRTWAAAQSGHAHHAAHPGMDRPRVLCGLQGRQQRACRGRGPLGRRGSAVCARKAAATGGRLSDAARPRITHLVHRKRSLARCIATGNPRQPRRRPGGRRPARKGRGRARSCWELR